MFYATDINDLYREKDDLNFNLLFEAMFYATCLEGSLLYSVLFFISIFYLKLCSMLRGWEFRF
ncbi:MAG: hypothetical protein GF316_17495 [Candidatus Lokiarchaeota archaeon]|nr:hypothetical protein [Candidatus Lokiarchaeota archaeon]